MVRGGILIIQRIQCWVCKRECKTQAQLEDKKMPGLGNQEISECENCGKPIAEHHELLLAVSIRKFSHHDDKNAGGNVIHCQSPGNIENIAADPFGEHGKKRPEHRVGKHPEITPPQKYFFFLLHSLQTYTESHACLK